MRTRADIRTARRRAAWLSLVALVLGATVVPALHRAVHAVEAHEHDAPRRRPAPVRAQGHAATRGHGHRHVAAGRHAHRPGAPLVDTSPAPRHQHHHDGGGDDRDPLRHGQGAPEHLGVALLGVAPPLVPPAPAATALPRASTPPTGLVASVQVRPNGIRGPPARLRSRIEAEA